MAVKKYAVPKAPGYGTRSDEATYHEKLSTARARARSVASKTKRPVAVYKYDRDVGRFVKHDVVAARLENPRIKQQRYKGYIIRRQPGPWWDRRGGTYHVHGPLFTGNEKYSSLTAAKRAIDQTVKHRRKSNPRRRNPVYSIFGYRSERKLGTAKSLANAKARAYLATKRGEGEAYVVSGDYKGSLYDYGLPLIGRMSLESDGVYWISKGRKKKVVARQKNPAVPRNRWINAKAVRVRRVKGRDVIDLQTR